MRSSAQRASANIGRRAQTTSGAGVQPGPLPTRRPTDDNVARASREYDDTARDTALNTELNKVNSECDRYKTWLEQARKKLRETQQQKDDLKQKNDDLKQQRDSYKSRVQAAKDEIASLLAELEDFRSANLELAARYEEMARQYRSLEERSNALAGLGSAGPTASHAASTALPDRTKSSYKPSAKDHREDRGHKGRSREEPREPPREAKESRESRESREYSEYMEYQAAEKERLKGRFGDMPSTTTSSSAQALRQNFIEGWGPGPGLEQQVGPPSRISTSHQVPAMSPDYNSIAYSTMPRTHAHMYKPNTAALYGPDGEYEGGCKYKPYPMTG